MIRGGGIQRESLGSVRTGISEVTPPITGVSLPSTTVTNPL